MTLPKQTMAKSKNRSRRVKQFSFAKRSLPTSLSPTRSLSRPFRENLEIFEDRRTFHPEGLSRPARLFSQPRHRLTLVDKKPFLNPDRFAKLRQFSGTKALVAFEQPSKVLICVRRQIRKEVLHALNKSGKSGQRSPRRNYFSEISCRKS